VPVVRSIWEASEKPYVFKGSPPVHHAAKQSSLGMVKFLVEIAGFSPDEYDNEGNTALHCAIKYSGKF